MCLRKCFIRFLVMTNVICFAQNRTVELEIIGKTYDNLYIRSHQLSNSPITYIGKSSNKSLWTFSIPDSIIKKSIHFDFRDGSSAKNHIGFFYVTQVDTLIGRHIHFEDDELLIRLKIIYHHTVHEVNYQYIPQLKKTIALQEWDCDYFSIDPNQNLYLKENMIDPFFGFFQSIKGYDESYDDILAEYASKIKKSPNSQYYMNRLATSIYLTSKKDKAQLYYLFSDKLRYSYFGKIMYNDFSTFRISNVSLKNCITKKEEAIVPNKDQNKYTLLIFSASWCAPCYNKIPVLKNIYKDMYMSLNMVYITLDDEKKLIQWRKLMQKEQIPWRSLLFKKELQDVWNIGIIPDYILISPNWEARKINLNDENDINNLIEIIHNN